MTSPPLVLDTNIVLDLFVFDDEGARALREAIEGSDAPPWLVTAAMRDELARVLSYPQVARRLLERENAPSVVLKAFDRHARVLPPPPQTAFICADSDDQKFVDLAIAHRARLISKDRAVLRMSRRLLCCGVVVARDASCFRHQTGAHRSENLR